MDDSKNKGKYCRSPESIGIKSSNQIIHKENHQYIDDERNKTKRKSIEWCSNHFQEKSNSRIHKSEEESHYESRSQTIYLYTRDNISCCKHSKCREYEWNNEVHKGKLKDKTKQYSTESILY